MEEALAQENQLLCQQVNQLLSAVAAMQTQLTQLQQPPPAPAPLPVSLRKCPISLPEKFDGVPGKFPAFLAQCELYMTLRPQAFPTDTLQVGFVISLLTDDAAKWATPLLLQKSPLLQNYGEFVEEFRAAYEDPQKDETANRRIRRLHQGPDSVATYTNRFRLLAQDLAWNEAALMDQFQEGLRDEVLDEVARVERPKTLKDLMHLCLRIDGRLESRREARRPGPSQVGTWGGQGQVPVAPAPNLQPNVEEPMQLGGARSRLSAPEKERRRQEGLCLYCGQEGHFARSCPAKQPRSMVSGNRRSQS